jgi:DNA-binding MurR/RpiR family transcriptional regulator
MSTVDSEMGMAGMSHAVAPAAPVVGVSWAVAIYFLGYAGWSSFRVVVGRPVRARVDTPPRPAEVTEPAVVARAVSMPRVRALLAQPRLLEACRAVMGASMVYMALAMLG